MQIEEGITEVEIRGALLRNVINRGNKNKIQKQLFTTGNTVAFELYLSLRT